ncbi:MAG: hypothetical protein WAX89_04015 [Alphaproteobacteria bacterium]
MFGKPKTPAQRAWGFHTAGMRDGPGKATAMSAREKTATENGVGYWKSQATIRDDGSPDLIAQAIWGKK